MSSDFHGYILYSIWIVRTYEKYNRRRKYQYNKDEFLFQVLTSTNFLTAWTHINIKTKLTPFLFTFKLVVWKKLVKNKDL